MTTKSARPARRPADRKAQILAAAVTRFHEFGYGATSMEDIARAVGITPGALYRHFRNKNELLLRALLKGLEQLGHVVERSEGLEGALRASGGFFLDHEGLPLLWDREISLLPEEQQDLVREQARAVTCMVAARLRLSRPELSERDSRVVARAALSVLASPSYHRTRLPRPRMEALLYEQGLSVCRTPVTQGPDGAALLLPDSGIPLPDGHGMTPLSRREALLMAGARLFSERGYQSVNMEQIGAAAGIAGPSIYKHFARKSDLLAAVLHRESEVLHLALTWSIIHSSTPEEALERLVRTFVTVLGMLRGSMGLSVTGSSELAGEQAHELRRAQQEYVAEWTTLLKAARPDLKDVDARVTVLSAFTLIRNLTLVPRGRRAVHTVTTVELALGALLPGAAGPATTP
ncbi:TetR/AcrR family transcriptional regulator [Streptomyces sp. NPDC004726]